MYEAFGPGDVAYVLAQMAPDVEWIETEAKNIPAHGTFANPQEVLQNVFAKVPEHFEQFELHPERWIEAGDDVVVTGRVVARTRTGRTDDDLARYLPPAALARSGWRQHTRRLQLEPSRPAMPGTCPEPPNRQPRTQSPPSTRKHRVTQGGGTIRPGKPSRQH